MKFDKSSLERVFVVLALVCLVGVMTPLLASPTRSGRLTGFTFNPEVPDEYNFSSERKAGQARVDNKDYESLDEAVDAADPGDTIFLRGEFNGPVVISKDGLNLVGRPADTPPLLQGDGDGDVLTIKGNNTVLKNVWVKNSGFDPGENDSGIWIEGNNVTVTGSRVSEVTFGIWLDGVNNAVVNDNVIVGRESVYPMSSRGNGIQIWKTENSLISNNRITDVRDGIYYSWASEVLGRHNTVWDLRYGVHYMYSDDCTLRQNLAFDNDSGYALMVSRNLTLTGNTAINNRGSSGHGILLKSIDYTTLENNQLIRNGNGFYVYNSLDNKIIDNLVLENKIGIQIMAGSVREEIYGNSFIANGESVRALIGEQVYWNNEQTGNFWSQAHSTDVNGDGVSEIRHQPAGILDRLGAREPLTRLFTGSPAFAVIRLAESSVPIIESPGVVDLHPLVNPSHTGWSSYYDKN